jgi:hypothetical protein
MRHSASRSPGRRSLIGRLRVWRPPAMRARRARSRAQAARQESRALAANDRLFEAIELLSAANRPCRDAENEVLLVRLRHRAFAQLRRSPPTTSWPPIVADPFPDVTGRPPEIMCAQLTPEVLGGALLHHGCLLVRGLISSSQVPRLIDDTDRAFEGRRAHSSGASVSETSPWFVPLDPDPGYARLDDTLRQFHIEAGAVLAAESPRTLFDIIDAYEGNGLIGAINGYLGERPAISLNKCVLRHTAFRESAANPTWHQDGAFLGEGVRAIDAWLSLSHCGGDTNAPGLEILPRRMAEILETGQGFQNAVTRAQVVTAAGDTPIVRPLFGPGDGLLFDERFLHRTGFVPGMTGERRAIETWFFAPSSFPRTYIPIAL